MSNEMNKMMENELENISGGANFDSNYYLVKGGDTLGDIAARYHTSVNNLMALNPRITNPNMIYAGETIRVW